MLTNNLNDWEVVKYINSSFKRYDVINHIIHKNNYNNYLEIGVFKGENIEQVKADHKDGVDPGAEGHVPKEVNYVMTSDQFFDFIKDHPNIKYDIIFIDGLHHSDQVLTDIENSLRHLVEGGYIVMHDCLPASFEAQLVPRQTVAWNGDVWRAFLSFKASNPSYECCVVDTDFGIGVIKNTGSDPVFKMSDITWENFCDQKQTLMNIVTVDDFLNKN